MLQTLFYFGKVHPARHYLDFFTLTNQINVKQTLKHVHLARLFHPVRLFGRLEYLFTGVNYQSHSTIKCHNWTCLKRNV